MFWSLLSGIYVVQRSPSDFDLSSKQGRHAHIISPVLVINRLEMLY
jgi:hypothetical protein